MDLNYSFLKDELALAEIRKHKWIESEKQKREVGFATAAVDWVKKYGQDWKIFRSGLKSRSDIFTERRIHRRFSCQIPVQIKLNGKVIMSYAESVNLMGFSCLLPQVLPVGKEVEVVMNFQGREALSLRFPVRFKSRVMKASACSRKPQDSCHKTFFLFDEDAKKYLRTNAALLNAGC